MDDELAAIRAARLQELQRNSGGGAKPDGSDISAQQSLKNAQQESLLSQILEPQARERLSRVRLVKPDRAAAVENYLTKLVQMGQLRHKLSEDEVVEILDGISKDTSSGGGQTKVIFNRRQVVDESEDEDDFFD